MAENRRILVCQLWEKVIDSWQTEPYGFSLHCNEILLQANIDDYQSRWAKDVEAGKSQYPHYRPVGDPYRCWVTEATFKEVKAAKFGLVFTGVTAPAKGAHFDATLS